MGHLKLGELIAFADPAMDKDDRKNAQAHLDGCAQCRARFISLQTFRASAMEVPVNLSSFNMSVDCVPTEYMGDFLGGRLPADEYSLYSNHIEQCDTCFERASFFNLSGIRMAEGILNMEPTPARYIEAVAPGKSVGQAEEPGSFFGKAFDWLRSPVPAYALAASLLFFMIIGSPGGSGDIIDLDSDKMFTLYQAPEHNGQSFGFSDAGRKIGEVDAGLAIRQVSSDLVEFRWNEVDDADEYQFSLQELRSNAPLEIYETTTTEPNVTVAMSMINKRKAYRWSVAGVADGSDQNKVFTAVGQFAFSR